MFKLKRSKRDIASFIWTFVVVILALMIKRSYTLRFWQYMIIIIPLLAVGNFVINKFIKIK